MSAFREPQRCVMCAEFPASEAAETGSAPCRLRGPQRWDDVACVNYVRVKNWYEKRDLDARKRWVIKLMELHPMKDEKQ